MSKNCPAWDQPHTETNPESICAEMGEFDKFVRRSAKSHVLDHSDLKIWHGRIFKNSVPLSYYAGNFRADDHQRPCLRTNVGVTDGATHFPGAPFADVPRLMRELSSEMKNRFAELDRLVIGKPLPVDRARWAVMLAAVYAGRFVRIHPFLNGNGRMSRLIANYVLGRYGYPPAYFDPLPRPTAGYAEASAAAMGGNNNPMFQYLLGAFAKGVA